LKKLFISYLYATSNNVEPFETVIHLLELRISTSKIVPVVTSLIVLIPLSVLNKKSRNKTLLTVNKISVLLSFCSLYFQCAAKPLLANKFIFVVLI